MQLINSLVARKATRLALACALFGGLERNTRDLPVAHHCRVDEHVPLFGGCT